MLGLEVTFCNIIHDSQMHTLKEELMELFTKEHSRLETIIQEQSLKDTSSTKEEATNT